MSTKDKRQCVPYLTNRIPMQKAKKDRIPLAEVTKNVAKRKTGSHSKERVK
jgi:hypothetical protein